LADRLVRLVRIGRLREQALLALRSRRAAGLDLQASECGKAGEPEINGAYVRAGLGGQPLGQAAGPSEHPQRQTHLRAAIGALESDFAAQPLAQRRCCAQVDVDPQALRATCADLELGRAHRYLPAVKLCLHPPTPAEAKVAQKTIQAAAFEAAFVQQTGKVEAARLAPGGGTSAAELAAAGEQRQLRTRGRSHIQATGPNVDAPGRRQAVLATETTARATHQGRLDLVDPPLRMHGAQQSGGAGHVRAGHRRTAARDQARATAGRCDDVGARRGDRGQHHATAFDRPAAAAGGQSIGQAGVLDQTRALDAGTFAAGREPLPQQLAGAETEMHSRQTMGVVVDAFAVAYRVEQDHAASTGTTHIVTLGQARLRATLANHDLTVETVRVAGPRVAAAIRLSAGIQTQASAQPAARKIVRDHQPGRAVAPGCTASQQAAAARSGHRRGTACVRGTQAEIDQAIAHAAVVAGIGDADHPRRVAGRGHRTQAWPGISRRHHRHDAGLARRQQRQRVAARPGIAWIAANRVVDDVDTIGHGGIDRRQQPAALAFGFDLACLVADQMRMRSHARELARHGLPANAETPIDEVAGGNAGHVRAMAAHIQAVVRLAAGAAGAEVAQPDQLAIAGRAGRARAQGRRQCAWSDMPMTVDGPDAGEGGVAGIDARVDDADHHARAAGAAGTQAGTVPQRRRIDPGWASIGLRLPDEIRLDPRNPLELGQALRLLRAELDYQRIQHQIESHAGLQGAADHGFGRALKAGLLGRQELPIRLDLRGADFKAGLADGARMRGHQRSLGGRFADTETLKQRHRWGHQMHDVGMTHTVLSRFGAGIGGTHSLRHQRKGARRQQSPAGDRCGAGAICSWVSTHGRDAGRAVLRPLRRV
jgi:hypothetical protein